MGSDLPEWALTAVKERCDFCDPRLSGGCATCFAWALLLTEAEQRGHERGVREERERLRSVAREIAADGPWEGRGGLWDPIDPATPGTDTEEGGSGG